MTKITKGSGNIFEDLGLPDAKEMQLKAILARKINSILKHRHLKQSESAALLDVSQSKISNLANGRLRGFSAERLMLMLVDLDRDVEIKISSRAKSNAAVKVTSGKTVEVAA